MPYLLPDDLDPDVFKCLTIRVPDDPQWEVNFWGALLELAKWFNHERDALHKGKIVADKWRGWIEEAMTCNTITDMAIVSNKLLIQRCNSEIWIEVGPINTIPMKVENGKIYYDVNGDGTFELSQYINTQQNIFGPGGLPVTDDNDRFCRASWIMANSLADDYADVAKKIDLLVNQIPSRGVQWLSSLTVFPPLIEFIESNIEGITAFIKDWVYGTARDPETIRKVAEILFCSIKDHYPDNLDNVISDLDLGAYEPTGGPIGSIYIWENFAGLAEVAYNSLTGTNTAYLILAYAKISESAVIQFLGLSTPVEDAMNYALNTAEHFDSRDCGGFDCMLWEHQVNFTTDVEIVRGFPIGEAIASANQNATWISPNAKRQICEFKILPIETPLPYGIIKVTAVVSTVEETWQAILLNYFGGSILDSDETHTSGNTERVLEPPEPLQGIWFWVASQIQEPSTPLQFSMTVTIQGNGTNPFE